jgi:hypothetical protein
MPDDQADLNLALSFVISRVEDAALRAGAPLSDNEQQVLRNLPTKSAIGYAGSDLKPFIPRDFVYEGLCSAAKAAYRADSSPGNPGESKWRFCAAVFRLNDHPMLWLLQWAGVDVPRPWWDRLLLVGAGLVLVGMLVGTFVVADYLHWNPGHYIGLVFYTGILIAMHFVLKNLEKWQAKRVIEALRPRD